MLTKAYVEEIVNDYQVRVRIPIFDKLASSPGGTPTEQLSISPICAIPGGKYNYSVGDIVFVTFEDNDLGRPVILGQLYADVANKGMASLTLDGLEVGQEAILPENTTIGNLSSQKLKDMSVFDFYGTQASLSQAVKEIGSWSLFMPDSSIQQIVQYLYQVMSQYTSEYTEPYAVSYIKNWYCVQGTAEELFQGTSINYQNLVGTFSSRISNALLYTDTNESSSSAPSKRMVSLNVGTLNPIDYSVILTSTKLEDSFDLSMAFDCGQIATRKLLYTGNLYLDDMSLGKPIVNVLVKNTQTGEYLDCDFQFGEGKDENDNWSPYPPYRYLWVSIPRIYSSGDGGETGEVFQHTIDLQISLALSIQYAITTSNPQSSTQGNAEQQENNQSNNQPGETSEQGSSNGSGQENNQENSSVCSNCQQPLDANDNCTNPNCPNSESYQGEGSESGGEGDTDELGEESGENNQNQEQGDLVESDP